MQMMEYVKTIVDALEDKKAHDIKVIRISEISSMADYLVLADGDNRNQIQAMSDNVEEAMRKAKAELKNREGYANGGWILLDYYDIIVHIFSETERSFYDLDRIWSDGEYVDLGERH
ncbi:MAG: ribosome silencing factor [Wujia sp.]